MTLRPGERDLAENLAAKAFAFLAAEPERLERFLSLAGIDPGNIRAAATEPGFLAAVMEHLMADEPLLLAFAANEGVKPGQVVKAARALGVVPWERGFA